MSSELSQTADKDDNEVMTREWGHEFILYDENDPGAVWVSINQSKVADLDEMR